MIIATKAATAVAQVLEYRWVAVGSSGSLYTSDSTTASSWTSRTSSFSTTNIRGVASDGVGLYVAVGAAGKLATSSDGITWTQRTSSFSTTDIWGVCYGGGYWVAVGDAGKVATSTDGITWTQRTSGTAQDLRAVFFGNGKYVLGGNGVAGVATCRSATDPTGTWTSRTSTLENIGFNGLYYAPDQAIWVAGVDSGTTGALASSPDGDTWTARNSATGMLVPGIGQAFTSISSIIVYTFYADGTPTMDINSSTNGTTWTDRTPADASESVTSAAVDEANFMIVVGSKVQSSTNGTSWTDRGAGPVNPLAVCHSSGVPAIR